ncbi:MAG: Zn-ribbon domain-containing OB-fold protein [Thermoplasmatota archaeon]
MGDANAHLARAPPLSLKGQREAVREGHIVGFRCPACGLERFSPMARCVQCGSTKVESKEFSSTGEVVAFTIQSVASENYLNETPFAFAIIKLDNGPQVTGWIPYVAKASQLAIGQRVKYVPSYKPGMQFEKVA